MKTPRKQRPPRKPWPRKQRPLENEDLENEDPLENKDLENKDPLENEDLENEDLENDDPLENEISLRWLFFEFINRLQFTFITRTRPPCRLVYNILWSRNRPTSVD